jgi:hypothetical protein
MVEQHCVPLQYWHRISPPKSLHPLHDLGSHGTLHTPLAHRPVAHWEPVVQDDPAGRGGEHVLPMQTVPDTQSASLPHGPPLTARHLPPEHVALSQQTSPEPHGVPTGRHAAHRPFWQ